MSEPSADLREQITRALTRAALDNHNGPTVMGQCTTRPEVRVSDVVAAVLPVVQEALDEAKARWVSETLTARPDYQAALKESDEHGFDDLVREISISGQVTAERDEALAVIEKVRALHHERTDTSYGGRVRLVGVCAGCAYRYPCPTVRALPTVDPAGATGGG